MTRPGAGHAQRRVPALRLRHQPHAALVHGAVVAVEQIAQHARVAAVAAHIQVARRRVHARVGLGHHLPSLAHHQQLHAREAGVEGVAPGGEHLQLHLAALQQGTALQQPRQVVSRCPARRMGGDACGLLLALQRRMHTAVTPSTVRRVHVAVAHLGLGQYARDVVVVQRPLLVLLLALLALN